MYLLTRNSRRLSSQLSFSQLKMSPLEAMVRILNNDVCLTTKPVINANEEKENEEDGDDIVNSEDNYKSGVEMGRDPESRRNSKDESNSHGSGRSSIDSRHSDGQCNLNYLRSRSNAGCVGSIVGDKSNASSCASSGSDSTEVYPNTMLQQLVSMEEVSLIQQKRGNRKSWREGEKCAVLKYIPP